jgi:hypothetical protein
MKENVSFCFRSSRLSSIQQVKAEEETKWERCAHIHFKKQLSLQGTYSRD